MSKNEIYEDKKVVKSSLIISILLFAVCALLMESTMIQSVSAWTYQGYKDLWTPRFLLNVPYNGKAEGETTWSSEMKFSFLFGGGGTLSYSGVGMTRENGECSGDFRLCRWYEYASGGNSYALLVSDKPLGWIWDKTMYLYGPDKTTCKDDVQSFTYGGYDSIWFDMRYHELNKIRDTDGSVTEHCHGSAYSIFELNIRVSIKHVSFGLVKAYWKGGAEWDYWYTFNGGNHRWYIDFLSSHTPSIETDELWAFDYQY